MLSAMVESSMERRRATSRKLDWKRRVTRVKLDVCLICYLLARSCLEKMPVDDLGQGYCLGMTNLGKTFFEFVSYFSFLTMLFKHS